MAKDNEVDVRIISKRLKDYILSRSQTYLQKGLSKAINKMRILVGPGSQKIGALVNFTGPISSLDSTLH